VAAQKSVVVVTALPFVSFFKRVVHVVANMYFEAGGTVFEVAHLNAAAWYDMHVHMFVRFDAERV
jgi:hypothetical protein